MAAKIASWVVRLGGLVMIVLGLLFWTGHATNLVGMHMLLGILVVLALWALAGIYAMQKGANFALAGTAFLVGVVVVFVGMTQTQLMPGAAHWVIEIIHLLLGLALISFGEIISGRMKRLGQSASVAAA